MNTKPDETLLELWVEDELTGAGLAAVEAWAATQPDWLAKREESRAWRNLMRRALPAAQEPPHLEFFHARIARATEPAIQVRRRPAWSVLTMPLAAAAAMALCFWAGTRFHATPQSPSSPVQSATLPSAPGTLVYVPEQGVKAKVYESEGTEAVVIVLDGVAAIPDSFELPDQAGPPAGDSSGSSTAAAGRPANPRDRTP